VFTLQTVPVTGEGVEFAYRHNIEFMALPFDLDSAWRFAE